MNQKLTEKLLKKDEQISKLSQELKETVAKLDKKDKEFEQEISELKRELTKRHDESVNELKEENTMLRQEIDTLKWKQDDSREEKAAMKPKIQPKMGQLKKQLTTTKSLVQDMTDMREIQKRDRTELDTTLQHSNANIGLVPFQITMSDFETHKAADDVWFSEPFYTHPGGYKMCLCVYANGYWYAKQTHMSVYVRLMRGMFDEHLKWPVLCDITIELLNQKPNKGHRRGFRFGNSEDDNAFRVTEGERAKDGWGIHTYIPHTELYRHRDDFINNGCICFIISNIEHRQ